MPRIDGTFEVKLLPLKQPADEGEIAALGRMSIDKKFFGELEAASKGEMLSFVSSVKGSAGYVALERVTGKLLGRSGSFVLQHNGTMNRGDPKLTVTVVPDSRTDELAGLSGKMEISIVDGKHYYDFEFEVPENR